MPGTVVAEQRPFFITLGGPKAHDSSVEKHSQERTADPPLRSPGFPVEIRGVDDCMRLSIRRAADLVVLAAVK